MFERYKGLIETYCQEQGIEIPVGFERHAAARYAAVDLERNPPTLVAITWSTPNDAATYLASLEEGHATRLLDFKERHELTSDGKGHLLRGQPF